MRWPRVWTAIGLTAALAGCGQAGMPQVSSGEAAKIGVATGRIYQGARAWAP